MKVSAISIQGIIVSIVAHFTSSQEAENVINENIEDEWAKYRTFWHTTVDNLTRTESIIDINFLHPFV